MTRGRRPITTPARLEGFARVLYGQLTGLDGIVETSTDFDYRGLTFSDFVIGVCDIIDSRPREAPCSRSSGARPIADPRTARRLEPKMNPHWNTQVPFWFEHTGFEYDEVYTLAQSETFFDRLATLLGRAPFRRVLNASRYAPDDTGPPRGAIVDVNSLDISRGRLSISKAGFESDALRRRVRESYAIDYRYIETSREDDTLRARRGSHGRQTESRPARPGIKPDPQAISGPSEGSA